MEINHIGRIAGSSLWYINTISGKNIPDFLYRDLCWITNAILLSHCSDGKVYANLNNKTKLTFQLPEYHKCLGLCSKLHGWLLYKFSSHNIMPFLTNRQSKASELQQYSLLLALPLFSPSYFFFLNNKKPPSTGILRSLHLFWGH